MRRLKAVTEQHVPLNFYQNIIPFHKYVLLIKSTEHNNVKKSFQINEKSGLTAPEQNINVEKTLKDFR